MKHTRIRALTIACLAALVGCQAQPGTAPRGLQPARPPQAPAAPAEAALPAAGTELQETILVDVDPLHGSAFERLQRKLQAISVAKKLKVIAEFPTVTHDPATGRTTVGMALTNAGDSLNYLACRVGGERKVISPNWQWNTTVSRSGQTQNQNLVFENPGGGAFTIELTFTGFMPAQVPLNTGTTTATTAPSATPTTAPSTAPTATPTAAPTTTPTPAPTPTPTPMPTPTPTPAPSATPSGGTSAYWSVTANSAYSGTPASRAIDGDLSTQWTNAEYQGATAWIAIDTGARRAIGSLQLKMKPQSGGATYRIETSDDAVAWTAVASGLKNSSWNLETKALPPGTEARHVRLVFTNDPTAPEPRFSVYEVKIDGAGGPLAPSPTPSPTTTSPPATGSVFMDFEHLSNGVDPADWVDPNDDGHSYAWMPRLAWKIVDHDGSKQYLHDNLAAEARLSFRRYNGTGLGTQGGSLPAKYFTELDVTPIQSYTYAPTGDQGTQVYYLTPTRYVEVLIKPQYYEVWSAIDAEPFQSGGWNRLWFMETNTAAGQKRKLGAEIDANAGTMKVYLDGVLQTTISSVLLTNQQHWFALRGAGNIVAHDNIRIEPR